MFATIYLPNFYLQAALRHQAELATQPVALLDDQEAKAVIIQLNQAAEDAGRALRDDAEPGTRPLSCADGENATARSGKIAR